MSDETDSEPDAENISNYDKLRSLYEVAAHRPWLTVAILVFGVATAALEGVGLGFILPIIEQTRDSGEPSGFVAVFASVYDAIGVPFTLEYIVLGVGMVIAVRYAASVIVQPISIANQNIRWT